MTLESGLGAATLFMIATASGIEFKFKCLRQFVRQQRPAEKGDTPCQLSNGVIVQDVGGHYSLMVRAEKVKVGYIKLFFCFHYGDP